MKVEELEQIVKGSTDAVSVKRVFGEPITHDGLTLIPVAKVGGMAGLGTGEGPEAQGRGGAAGFRVAARALGTYVIKGDTVRFVPAVDVNRLLGIAGAVMVAAVIFVLGPIAKARSTRP